MPPPKASLRRTRKWIGDASRTFASSFVEGCLLFDGAQEKRGDRQSARVRCLFA